MATSEDEDSPLGLFELADDELLSSELIQRLRVLAERATPGPWITWDDGDVGTAYPVTRKMRSGELKEIESVHIANTAPDDGEYIAAIDPTTLLLILKRLEELEAKN